jgi:hypothetical protein
MDSDSQGVQLQLQRFFENRTISRSVGNTLLTTRAWTTEIGRVGRHIVRRVLEE